jgi:hypothetical protein
MRLIKTKHTNNEQERNTFKNLITSLFCIKNCVFFLAIQNQLNQINIYHSQNHKTPMKKDKQLLSNLRNKR